MVKKTPFDEDVYKYIVKPFLILVGMAISGSLIDGFLRTGNAFAIIFTVAGGIPAVGLYFRKAWTDK